MSTTTVTTPDPTTVVSASVPTLESLVQSLIKDVRANVDFARDMQSDCMQKASKEAYELVMETGQGWGSDGQQREKAHNHLRRCAQDGGRANIYHHQIGMLELLLKDLLKIQTILPPEAKVPPPFFSAPVEIKGTLENIEIEKRLLAGDKAAREFAIEALNGLGSTIVDLWIEHAKKRQNNQAS
jgi:hypothetical protein